LFQVFSNPDCHCVEHHMRRSHGCGDTSCTNATWKTVRCECVSITKHWPHRLQLTTLRGPLCIPWSGCFDQRSQNTAEKLCPTKEKQKT